MRKRKEKNSEVYTVRVSRGPKQRKSSPSPSTHIYGLPSGSVVKSLPAMQEIRVRSLGWENTLEKEMATHSSTLAWRIPWTEEPGGLQCTGSQSQVPLFD